MGVLMKLSSKTEQILILIGTFFFWASLYVYVPILSPYTKELGGSLTIVGFVVASYGLSQFLFRFPLGIWSDRLGRRKPFVISGFVFTAISCLGLALSPNPWILLIFRGIAGISASMWVALTVMYSHYFDDKQSTKAMSLISFCTGFSQMIITYIGGNIAQKQGSVYTFYYGIGLAVIGMLFILPVSETRIINSVDFSIKKVLSVASRKLLLTVSILTALSQFSVFVITYGFLTIYATEIGASKSQLGTLMFVTHLALTISNLLAGTFVAPKIGYRMTVFLAFISVSIITIITPFIKGVNLLILLNGLGTLGRGLAAPILMGLAIQGLPKEEKASAMGFYQAVYALGMFLGPATGGMIGDTFGLAGVFYCAGAIYLITSLASIIILPSNKRIR